VTPVEFIVVIVASAAGSVVHSCAGIGLGLVAGPALVAIDPDFVPGPVLLVGILVNGRNAVDEYRHLDRSALRNCLWGLPVGLVAGLAVLEAVSDQTMALLIGGFTTLAALALLSGLRLHRGTITERVGGAITGFATTTASLPGPPLVLTYSDLRPGTLRATAGTIILVAAGFALVLLAATGNFGHHELELSARLVPGVVAGLVASRWVRPLVDRHWFRPLVLTVAMAGGLALVIRNIV
jgi:uncharacterized membrane protein YfcA